MSELEARPALLRGLRLALVDLVEDGIEFVPRPPQPRAADESPPERPREPARRTPDARVQQSGRALSAGPPVLVPPLAWAEPPGGPRAEALLQVREELGDCQRCRLCETRQSIVFGEGHPDAPVVFVGEGPGADEDRSGRPFVGRAGELLTKMITAVGWRREDVYICNIVKCRPPENRVPLADEVAECSPFLGRQLLAIRPRAIVALGKPASSALLGRNVSITKIRGIWQDWNGTPLMPTYHPAYLLRNYTRETRQAVWDDLRAVRARVDGAV